MLAYDKQKAVARPRECLNAPGSRGSGACYATHAMSISQEPLIVSAVMAVCFRARVTAP